MINDIKDHMIDWLRNEIPCNVESEEAIRFMGMTEAVCELCSYITSLDLDNYSWIREACENPKFNEKLAKFMKEENVLED